MFTQTNRARRGQDFLPPQEILCRIPGLYETEHTSRARKKVYVHYFLGTCDWWIVELEQETGIAFGFACLGNSQSAGWGFISLVELEEIAVGPLGFVVERDDHWQPQLVREIPEIPC